MRDTGGVIVDPDGRASPSRRSARRAHGHVHRRPRRCLRRAARRSSTSTPRASATARTRPPRCRCAGTSRTTGSGTPRFSTTKTVSPRLRAGVRDQPVESSPATATSIAATWSTASPRASWPRTNGIGKAELFLLHYNDNTPGGTVTVGIRSSLTGALPHERHPQPGRPQGRRLEPVRLPGHHGHERRDLLPRADRAPTPT